MKYQMRNDGTLDEDANSGDGEKWIDAEHVPAVGIDTRSNDW